MKFAKLKSLFRCCKTLIEAVERICHDENTRMISVTCWATKIVHAYEAILSKNTTRAGTNLRRFLENNWTLAVCYSISAGAAVPFHFYPTCVMLSPSHSALISRTFHDDKILPVSRRIFDKLDTRMKTTIFRRTSFCWEKVSRELVTILCTPSG